MESHSEGILSQANPSPKLVKGINLLTAEEMRVLDEMTELYRQTLDELEREGYKKDVSLEELDKFDEYFLNDEIE